MQLLRFRHPKHSRIFQSELKKFLSDMKKVSEEEDKHLNVNNNNIENNNYIITSENVDDDREVNEDVENIEEEEEEEALFFSVFDKDCESSKVESEKFKYDFGEYIDLPRVNETYLVSKIPKIVKKCCKSCEYIDYKKIFYQIKDIYTWTDSFITFQGKFIVVLTNRPPDQKWGMKEIRPRSRQTFNGTYIKIFFSDLEEEEGIRIDMFEEDVIYSDLTIRLLFKIDDPMLLDHCFKIMLYDDNDKKILTERLLVRHCYGKENEERKNLAICSQIEPRERFMVEYVEYYLEKGVDHFYFFLHPGGKDPRYDRTASILKYYINQGYVTITIWNYTVGIKSRDSVFYYDQIAAYNDCIYRYRDFYEWMYIGDDDEFMVPKEEMKIHEVLNEQLELWEQERTNTTDELGAFTVFSLKYSKDRRTRGNLTLALQMYQFPGYGISTTEYLIEGKHHDQYIYRKIALRFVGFDSPIYTRIHNLEEKNQYKNIYIEMKELYIAHLYFRKWHEENPPRNGGSKETGLSKMVPLLEQRINEKEHILKSKQYGFNYTTVIKKEEKKKA